MTDKDILDLLKENFLLHNKNLTKKQFFVIDDIVSELLKRVHNLGK